MRLQIDLIRARLRAPFVSASGSLRTRDLLLVALEGDDGVTGFGEAAPLQGYDGVALRDVRTALEDCRSVLAGSDGADDRADLLAVCARTAILPHAIAALDLALWDLAGRRSGQPVWQLLGALDPGPVEVNATIARTDRAGASREAARARAAGFRCLKVKVGLGDDAGRVAAVRAAAGPEMAIRLDANGAWSVPEAVAALGALAPAGIECCEEPVHGVDAISRVWAAAPVAVAIDESSAGALHRRVCDSVCLKVVRCGGISGLLDAATRACAVGYEVYLASTLDGPLGIAAALHAAAVIQPDRPCGLATLGLFSDREDPLPPREGRLSVPAGPGLGAGLLAWYGA